MSKINIKTSEEIEIMKEGGKKLFEIRNALAAKVAEGVSAMEIEELALKLIKASGGESSFKMVPGYKWCTCINVNEGIVHGIPKKEMIFKKGDLVSIDVGLFYKGFHTDTSTTVLLGSDKEKEKMLHVGKKALECAISQAVVGNKVYDISKAIEDVLIGAKLTPIRALTGHGVGRHLHESPFVPCFTKGDSRSLNIPLEAGLVLAIEVMYAKGSPEIMVEKDGWTISTQDGKISALFEETVGITKSGPVVLTK